MAGTTHMNGESAGACLAPDILLDCLEGRATPAQRAEMEGHASQCAECRQVLSSLARDGASITPLERPFADASTIAATPSSPGAPPEGVTVPDQLDELAPGATVARYVVRARLGSGGMGVVYAALDPELGREVAIKLLAPRLGSSGARTVFEERLRREARALAQLAHPNVVAIHDVGRVGDRLFIAMELLEGVTLARWCDDERRTPHEILEKFLAAGHGLAAAHRAGIVHRDVKPENMMLGKDGRVRVVDFGLARTRDTQRDEVTGTGTSPSDNSLTVTGAMMGTPHYMAPEQYRGEEADARTDQFAFCVALYVMLYDARPFAGDDLDSLARAVQDGALREPPPRRGVPRRIWRALRRGMSTEPGARFPTLDALLAQIAPARRARWVSIAGGGALVAAASVTALVLGMHHAEPPAPCQDLASYLTGVWDGARRDKVTAALRATGVPFADDTARTVASHLDFYAARWVAMREDACTATRVRGDQTEQAMTIRMACLDDRLQEVGALVDRLLDTDRASVGHAVAATYELTDLTACADIASLPYRAKPPHDPALVAAARAKLATARAFEVTGRFRDGLGVIAATAPLIVSAAFRPLEAEAALLEGTLHNDADETSAAMASLEHAVLSAEACGYDQIATKALVELVHLHGRAAKFADADTAQARATAALERIGNAPELSADLDYAVGIVAIVRGDLTGAEAAFGRALRTVDALHGTADLRLASTLVALGQVELRRRNGKAGPYLERALAIQERLLGRDHPDLAVVHVALGGAAYERADYEGAAAHYERAIAILEHALGRENLQVGNALANLAQVRQWQARAEEALDLVREAVAIDAKVLPSAAPVTAGHLVTEADILEQLDRHAEALAVIDRTLEMLHTLYGADHQDIADALHSRALIELAQSHLESALADGRASLAMFDRVNPTYPTVELDRTLGRIELALHDPAAAVGYFESALQHARTDGDPYDAAWLNGLYGRALVESHRDRDRGIALVTAAYQSLRSDTRADGEWRELERWMRANSVPVPRIVPVPAR